jgi:hypothetical protein
MEPGELASEKILEATERPVPALDVAQQTLLLGLVQTPLRRAATGVSW